MAARGKREHIASRTYGEDWCGLLLFEPWSIHAHSRFEVVYSWDRLLVACLELRVDMRKISKVKCK